MHISDARWRLFVVALILLLGLALNATRALAQTVTTFPLPEASSQPYAIVVGPDGALWFTEANASRIGRITTSGTITEFTIPTATDSFGIAVGSDGNLWFTEFGTLGSNGAKIGRITPAGVITEFPTLTADSGPYGIAAGPDHALWFTENSVGKIGRITTAGVVTEFSPPTPNSLPEGITAGPDGAMWFTETSGNKIGRITTAGVITEYLVPTQNSFPEFIIAGPDGNLWFTEFFGQNVGRVTTAGNVSEFSVPVPAGVAAPTIPLLAGITVGSDGALWVAVPTPYTEINAAAVDNFDLLARVSVSGTVTDTLLPAHATNGDGPTGIVTGPDGALWFTDNVGEISRMPPPSSSSALLASILPESRSAQPNGTVTAFATIINSGTTTGTGCSIAPAGNLPAGFVYQTTNPATNALTGTANTPVNIPGNDQFQTFVIAFTPTTAIAPINEAFIFSCTNAAPAPIFTGLNTLLLSASTSPTPDVIALGATLQNDGIVHVTGSPMEGVFAVATDNIGSGSSITVATNTGAATLPITVTLCQTNPTTGACLQTPSATVDTTIGSDTTATFAVFVSASNTVPFNPANNRIFVTFTDSTNTIRGETSVAVETK